MTTVPTNSTDTSSQPMEFGASTPEYSAPPQMGASADPTYTTSSQSTAPAGEGSKALEFLDNERQNVARGLSQKQREDLAAGVGAGTTFGVLNTLNSDTPDVYEEAAQKIENSGVPNWQKPLRKLVAEGGAVRRFSRPLIGGALATYTGKRMTRSFLDEEDKYNSSASVTNEHDVSGPQKTASWLDEMGSFFRSSDDVAEESVDASEEYLDEAMDEFARRADEEYELGIDALSPKEVEEGVEGVRRDMRLDDAAEKVENDTAFQMRESLRSAGDTLKTRAGDFGRGMKDELKGFGNMALGAGVIGGGGALGKMTYDSTTGKDLNPRQQRAVQMGRSAKNPAGPIGVEAQQRFGGRQRSRFQSQKTASTNIRYRARPRYGPSPVEQGEFIDESTGETVDPDDLPPAERRQKIREGLMQARGEAERMEREARPGEYGAALGVTGSSIGAPLAISGSSGESLGRVVSRGAAGTAAGLGLGLGTGYLAGEFANRMDEGPEPVTDQDIAEAEAKARESAKTASDDASFEVDWSTIPAGLAGSPAQIDVGEGANSDKENKAKTLLQQSSMPFKYVKKFAQSIKEAGGPGSGVSYDNTAEITSLEKSPVITLHKRKKVQKHREPDRRPDALELEKIDYGAQNKYVVEKLAALLGDPEGWTDEPIDVAKVDGEYHLMDGHHRYLAARRLDIGELPAKVWMLSKPEVDYVLKETKTATENYSHSTRVDPNTSDASGGFLGHYAGDAMSPSPEEVDVEGYVGEHGSSLGHLKQAARSKDDLPEQDGYVKYNGKWMKTDQPVESTRKGKKRMVLAEKDGDVKLIHYGSSDYDHNYSEKAKQNYLARSGGMKGTDDKFSANYWARKDLWPEDQEADGSARFDLGDLFRQEPGQAKTAAPQKDNDNRDNMSVPSIGEINDDTINEAGELGAGLGLLAGAGGAASKSFGDNAESAFMSLNPIQDQDTIDRIQEFGETRKISDPTRRVDEYVDQGSRLMQDDLIDLPGGASVSGYQGMHQIRGGTVNKMIRPFLDTETADRITYDPKSEGHYKAFRRGPLAASGYLHHDLDANDPWENFKSDVGQARAKAIQRAGRGGQLREDKFRDAFASEMTNRVEGFEPRDARDFADQVEDEIVGSVGEENRKAVIEEAATNDSVSTSDDIMEMQKGQLESLFPGEATSGRHAENVVGEGYVQRAQAMGHDVSSVDELNDLPRETQSEILRGEGGPDAFHRYNKTKIAPTAQDYARSYREGFINPLYDGLRRFQRIGTQTMPEVGQRLARHGRRALIGGAGLAGLGLAGDAAVGGLDDSDDKTAAKQDSEDEFGIGDSIGAGLGALGLGGVAGDQIGYNIAENAKQDAQASGAKAQQLATDAPVMTRAQLQNQAEQKGFRGEVQTEGPDVSEAEHGIESDKASTATPKSEDLFLRSPKFTGPRGAPGLNRAYGLHELGHYESFANSGAPNYETWNQNHQTGDGNLSTFQKYFGSVEDDPLVQEETKAWDNAQATMEEAGESFTDREMKIRDHSLNTYRNQVIANQAENWRSVSRKVPKYALPAAGLAFLSDDVRNMSGEAIDSVSGSTKEAASKEDLVNKSEKAMEKGEEVVDQTSKNWAENPAVAGASGLAAASGYGVAFPRTRVYHGTDSDAASKIKSEGFKSDKNKRNIYDSKQRTFFTDNKSTADAYAGRSGKTLTADVPLDNYDDVLERDLQISDGKIYAVGDDIPARHVRGLRYRPPGPVEIGRYAKNTNRGRAGAGLLLAGLGGLAYAGQNPDADQKARQALGAEEKTAAAGPLAMTAGGAGLGASISYLGQKAQKKKVSPYAVGRDALIGGAVGGLSQPAIRRADETLRRFDETLGDADLTLESANRVIDDAGETVEDASTKLDDTKETVDDLSDKADDTMDRANETFDNVDEAADSAKDVSDKARNNRFFGAFKGDPDEVSTTEKVRRFFYPHRKNASASKFDDVADAFGDFVKRTDGTTSKEFESMLPDGATVRERPVRDVEEGVVDFGGDSPTETRMWEVDPGDGRESAILPGVDADNNIQYPDELASPAGHGDARSVSPIPKSKAESTGPLETEFRLGATDDPSAEMTEVGKIFTAGLIGGGGYLAHQKAKDRNRRQQRRLQSEKNKRPGGRPALQQRR